MYGSSWLCQDKFIKSVSELDQNGTRLLDGESHLKRIDYSSVVAVRSLLQFACPLQIMLYVISYI